VPFFLGSILLRRLEIIWRGRIIFFQLPAQREELTEALEEGITLVDGAMLQSATLHEGTGLALACVRVRFEAGEVRGDFTVTPLAGSEFTLAADALVVSIGQDPELSVLPSSCTRDGALLQVDARQATSVDRVWAGGDLTSMARFVTQAVGMGERAAKAIDDAFNPGRDRADDPGEPVVGLSNIATYYYPPQARAAAAHRGVDDRLASGAEVQLGLELEQTLAEAGRCFSCGTCIHCDNCFHYCPDLAVKRVDGGYAVLTDYCKGCGICVRECPTGSMKMREELR